MKDPEEAKEEIKEQAKKVSDRSKTAEERLEKYFEPKAEKQPEPTPSSDQTTEEAEVPNTKVKPEVEEKAAPVLDEEEALLNSKNPERTKAYIDKLKKERDEALAKAPQPASVNADSVMDIFHPEDKLPEIPPFPQTPQFQQPQQLVQTPYLDPTQFQNIVTQYTDAQGNIDPNVLNVLNNALAQANQRSYMAELAAEDAKKQVARIEENAEVREAHAEFPEIDPIKAKTSGTFDQTLFNNVQMRLIQSMGHRHERLVDIVREEKAKLTSKGENQPSKQETETQQRANQQARNQEPFGSGERQPETDFQQLKRETRTGRLDNPALDKRLDDYFKSVK